MYKKFLPLIIATSMTCSLQAIPSVASQDALLKEISSGFCRIAKDATPAVVYIESQATKETRGKERRSPSENPFDYFHDEFFNRFFGFPSPGERSKKSETVRGSGFIVSSDGYIMTNNHVVDTTSKLAVTLPDGRKYTATVVGTDPQTDLAVIKIEEKNLSYLTFGDSDALEVGDWAIAIGNPFGLQASVTVGVVSAKGRNQLNIIDFEDFIQTDAAINPGNSGGPLLNINGKVIGINTAIVSGSGGYMGIGFAIPSSMASRVKDQLINEGSVTRGFLGVTLQPIDSDLASFYKLEKIQGALVTDVVKDSPAEKAGLKQEDIIVACNNIPIESLSSFRNMISLMPPGEKITLKVNREGKVLTLKVTIAKLPEEIAETSSMFQKLGLQVETLTPELAQTHGYTKDKGVMVSKVLPGSPAEQAGVRSGALILAVNRKKVSSVEEFNTAMQEATSLGKVLLMMRQGETFRFVTLDLD